MLIKHKAKMFLEKYLRIVRSFYFTGLAIKKKN